MFDERNIRGLVFQLRGINQEINKHDKFYNRFKLLVLQKQKKEIVRKIALCSLWMYQEMSDDELLEAALLAEQRAGTLGVFAYSPESA